MRLVILNLFVFLFISTKLSAEIVEKTSPKQTPLYETAELKLEATAALSDPFKKFPKVAFSKGNRTINVEGFYSGGNTWTVRFMPDQEGTWNYQWDFGNDQGNGRFECAGKSNPNNHGHIKIDPTHPKYLRHEDGTPHYFFGSKWLGGAPFGPQLKMGQKNERYFSNQMLLDYLDTLKKYRHNGDFDIAKNDSLVSLSGLQSLKSTGQDLTLELNPLLNSVTGIGNLVTVGGDFDIVGNGRLTSLMGLEDLIFIGANLKVDSNPVLTSIVELENLDTVKGEFIIKNNAKLKICGSQIICNLSASASKFTVSGNGSSCADLTEFQTTCEPLSLKPVNLFSGSGISVSPNPFKERLIFNFPKKLLNGKLRLFNVQGKLILKKDLKEGHSFSVPIKNVPSGVFILLIQGEGVFFNKRVVFES